MKNRRYFIIYVSGINEEGEQQQGRIEMHIDNGGFFSEVDVQNKVSILLGIEDCFIKGWYELSEPDFFDFIDGREPLGGEPEDDYKNFV